MDDASPDPAPADGGPVVVRMCPDAEVVQIGMAALLGREPHRVHLVDSRSTAPVDVVLFDPTSRSHGGLRELATRVGASGVPVVAFSWSQERRSVDHALRVGAAGYLFKGLPGPVLVSALVRVGRGEVVVRTSTREQRVGTRLPSLDRLLDVDSGLSRRELEIVMLIADGFSNLEIADLAYLSVNTVKTYIRSAYRKLGVTCRTQAVRWALDRQRSLVPASDPV